jgi:hypothetical protein
MAAKKSLVRPSAWERAVAVRAGERMEKAVVRTLIASFDARPTVG